MAASEFLMFSDHDDFLEPDTLYGIELGALNEDRIWILFIRMKISVMKGEAVSLLPDEAGFQSDFLGALTISVIWLW